MQQTCETCYYGQGAKCSIMTEKSPCFAWADEAEARKRAEDIKDYTTRGEEITTRNRVYRRPAREKLDEGFLELYEKGANDPEIAETLGVSNQSVRAYRQKRGLPTNRKRRKRRSVGAEAAR